MSKSKKNNNCNNKKTNNKAKKNEITLDSIVIELLSDTTFSSGYETLGEVDVEVQYDELGLPFLSGKALHGLLRDGWLSIANTFFKNSEEVDEMLEILFGCGKKNDDNKCILRISDAKFYSDGFDENLNEKDSEHLRKWLDYGINEHTISPEMILNIFSSIRTQTSINEEGVASEGSLRYTRVISNGIKFRAKLDWIGKIGNNDKKKYWSCLALAVLSVKNIGLARNRGRGHVLMTLNGDLDLTRKLAKEF